MGISFIVYKMKEFSNFLKRINHFLDIIIIVSSGHTNKIAPQIPPKGD
jgi:hypothetical protein